MPVSIILSVSRPVTSFFMKGSDTRPKPLSAWRAGTRWGESEEARPRGRPSGSGAATLGPCPLCGSEVLDQAKSYNCSGWQRGCRFAIWKTIAGKRITARTAQVLLKQARSPVLKGFVSKSGKLLEARLRLEGGEVRFDFGS